MEAESASRRQPESRRADRQYDPTKLISWGINRWAFKPELGYSERWGNWVLDAYAGAWFYTMNSASYDVPVPKPQSEQPIGSLEGHLSRDFKTGTWVSFKKHLALTALIPGLQVKVKGSYNPQNQLLADSVEYKASSLQTAQDIQAGVGPRKQQLQATERQVQAQQQDIQQQQAQLKAEQQATAEHAAEIAAGKAAIALW